MTASHMGGGPTVPGATHTPAPAQALIFEEGEQQNPGSDRTGNWHQAVKLWMHNRTAHCMCVFQHVELASEVSPGRHSVQQRACPVGLVAQERHSPRGPGKSQFRHSQALRAQLFPRPEGFTLRASCPTSGCRENLGAGVEEAAPRCSQRSPRRNPAVNKKLCVRSGSAPTTAGAAGPAASLRVQGPRPPVAVPPPLRPPPPLARPPPRTTPARAPAPAAPPVRSGPARLRPLALVPGGGAGGAAVPSRARAGRVPIACCTPGLATPLGFLAKDADDSWAPKGSLRKFLEHLSGAGKAIGVLTSGGDAQVPRRLMPHRRPAGRCM
ncbi:uncharacterized protein [Macaca fascicularis]|uniref:uncharacterized protein n=1 Tax=Macaca fascicularis TaxID=9541 RepID=UPI003D157A4C